MLLQASEQGLKYFVGGGHYNTTTKDWGRPGLSSHRSASRMRGSAPSRRAHIAIADCVSRHLMGCGGRLGVIRALAALLRTAFSCFRFIVFGVGRLPNLAVPSPALMMTVIALLRRPARGARAGGCPVCSAPTLRKSMPSQFMPPCQSRSYVIVWFQSPFPFKK